MKDITPKTRLEGQRGHATRTRPWLDVAERFRAVEAFAPMLRFVESVAASPASSQLFVSTSMFDLGVSDSADFRTGDSTLCISYRPRDGMFHFRHRSYSGHNDEKSCSESEALETFRLFVRLKFGVLYEKPLA
jgi:hypothetical protein